MSVGEQPNRQSFSVGRQADSAQAGAAHNAPDGDVSLPLEPVTCCICETDEAAPVAVGEDFEYRTSSDTFLAMSCRWCGLVYLRNM